MECDAAHVAEVMDERGQVDAAVLVFPELHADAVVGNGADDDVVVVGWLAAGVVAVQQDKLGPLLAVVVRSMSPKSALVPW